MLNKAICKLCHKQNGVHWFPHTNDDWKSGYVACPGKYTKFKIAMTSNKELPPKHCPYSLEHAVSKPR